MHKKSFIKCLTVMMFAALMALTLGTSKIGATGTGNDSQQGSVVAPEENKNSKYSVVEKNGVVLSSDEDVFYSSAMGTRAKYTVRLGTTTNVVFTNVYYYSRTNQLVRVVDPEGAPTSSAEFEYTLYTSKSETELTVYYTTTESTRAKSISLLFMKDTTAPVVQDLKIDEVASVKYGEFYKSVKLVTSAAEAGIVQSGIESVKYYSVDDGVKSNEVEVNDFDPTNLQFDLAPAAAGNSKLCVVVTDKVGLTGEACSELYNFDNAGPQITLTPDATADEVLASHSVYVSVNDVQTSVKSISFAWVKFDSVKTPDELKAEIESYDLSSLTYTPTESESYVYTPAADNNHVAVYVLIVKATDNLGNESYSYSSQLSVLRTATPYLIAIADNPSEALSSHSAVFSINSNNIASLEEVIYAWAPESNGYPFTFADLKNAISGTSYQEKGILTLTGAEKYTITAHGLDGKYVLLVGIKTVDNEMVISSLDSGVELFVFDNTKPTVMIDPDGSVKTAQKTYEVNVTVNEANFESTVYYALLEQELSTISAAEIIANGKIFVAENRLFTITLGSEAELNGTYHFYLLVKDAAGNEVIASRAFLFDNMAPTVVIDVEDRYYANTEVVSVITADESAIVKYEYAWAKNDPELDLSKLVYTEVAENAIPASTILADGEYVLVVRVTDVAGNVSSSVVSSVFKFDVSSPVIKGIENSGYYTSAVTVEAQDSNDVVLTLNGVEIENNSEISATGFYKLSVKDALGNETVAYFVINAEKKATINNKKVNVEKQQYAPIQCENGECYVELARGTYAKDSAIVLTTTKDSKYVMLNQEVSHITVTKDLKSTLSIRKYKLGIEDASVIASTADENGYYGYINIHVISIEDAIKLGIEETVIDNEAVTLSLGLAGTFALVGIYFVSRGKKSRI